MVARLRRIIKKGCLLLIVISLLSSAVLLAIGLLVPEDSKQPKERVFHQPIVFLKSSPPDYGVTAPEVKKFEGKLSTVLSKSELNEAGALMKKLKVYYPEGYHLVVKRTLGEPREFKDFFEGDNETSADFLVHEMTHGGTNSLTTSLYEIGYWIEDKAVSFKIDEWKLFPGKEVFERIKNPTYIDELYLKKNDQNLYITLDEVNAYIKSTRVSRTYNYQEGTFEVTDERYVTTSTPSTLARQLFILTLHLKHAKENYPATWDLLVKNKAFAFTLMRLTKMAEAEIEFSKDEGLVSPNLDENLAAYNGNEKILNEFLAASGVKKWEKGDLSHDELQKKGINLTIKRY